MARASYSTTPLLRSLVHRPQGVILVKLAQTQNQTDPAILHIFSLLLMTYITETTTTIS